jgi:hypothetical protein
MTVEYGEAVVEGAKGTRAERVSRRNGMEWPLDRWSVGSENAVEEGAIEEGLIVEIECMEGG